MCESGITCPRDHDPYTCRDHSPKIKVLWDITISLVKPRVGGLRSSCLYLGLDPSSNHIKCGPRPSYNINKPASMSNHAELHMSTTYRITCIIITNNNDTRTITWRSASTLD